MRILLLVYFTFCMVADPWVDGRSMEPDSHSEIEISVEASQANGNAANQTLSNRPNQESHHHNNCPEHTCHLGHCGVVVGERMSFIPTALNEQFNEYRQSVPSSPIFGFKRPPKSNA